MKKTCTAILALGLMAGTAMAEPRMNMSRDSIEMNMSRDAIVLSTQDAAAEGKWVGPMLTILVLMLIFAGGGFIEE